jgi:hypothetical protein
MSITYARHSNIKITPGLQEAGRELVFTPRINDYDFKDRRSSDVWRSHEKSQLMEREMRRNLLKVRTICMPRVHVPCACNRAHDTPLRMPLLAQWKALVLL